MVEREGLGPAWGYICEAMDSRGGKSSGKGEKDKAGGEEDTTRLLRILLETYVGSDEKCVECSRFRHVRFAQHIFARVDVVSNPPHYN